MSATLHYLTCIPRQWWRTDRIPLPKRKEEEDGGTGDRKEGGRRKSLEVREEGVVAASSLLNLPHTDEDGQNLYTSVRFD